MRNYTMALFEILVTDVDTSGNVYSVLYNGDADISDQVAESFVSVVDGDWDDYAIAMTELGTNTNTYRGDFPAWITTGGTYFWVCYEQLGVSPNVSDDVLASGMVQWTGTAVTEGSIPVVEGDLFSLAEYKVYKGITSVDATRDATLEHLIDAVSNAVKRYVDHSVVAATRDETYHGNGANWVSVDNYPIAAVSSITFDYGSDDPEVVAGGEFTYTVDGNNGTILFNPNSTLARRFTGNIRVQYSAGYTDELRPEDLKLAGMLWVCSLKGKSETGLNKKSEKLGDYSYTLAGGGEDGSGMPNEVKMLLNTYKAAPLL
jgi:hypothetical protein